MEIAIVGAGYVGLTSAACFCELGHRVHVVEIDAERLALLQRGECPIFEPGLPELLRRHLGTNLSVTDRLQEAVTRASFLFVCVGTPPRSSGAPDLAALRQLLLQLRRMPDLTDQILVMKSTVPPGTCRRSFELLDGRLQVVSNPEFLREGTALDDFFRPDRIVAGSTDANAALAVAGLYKGVGAPLLITGWEEAELIKYASNAFLAIKVSFANEIAALCEALAADGSDVLQGVGLDRRIGPQFLRPGPGYGGSCLPKDVRALVWRAKRAGIALDLIPAAERSNRRQRYRLLAKLTKALGGLAGKVIAIWGLAFKAGTDDLRGAASVEIVAHLLQNEARVQAYDPAASSAFGRLFPPAQWPALTLTENPRNALRGAHGLLILTEWDLFGLFAPSEIAGLMAGKVVVDGRNLLVPEEMEAAGLFYQGVGKGRTK